MLSEGAFLIQLISYFMKRPDFLFAKKFSFYCHSAVNSDNGSIKNKILKNGSILTEKFMKESCIPKITLIG